MIRQRFTLTILFLFSLTLQAFAQNGISPALKSLTAPGSESEWLIFDSDLGLDAKTLFQNHSEAFGLSPQDEMVLIQVQTDDLGFSHYRFQQYHQGVAVEGAQFVLHSQNGILKTGNGHLETNLSLLAKPSVSGETAFQQALLAAPAQRYLWELPSQEALLKRIRKDPAATFFPTPELIIADSDFSPRNEAAYHLCYKFDVQAAQPLGRTWVYIDAQTGTLFKELNMLMHSDSAGVGETKYRGARSITTGFFVDSTGAKLFRLRQAALGGGVETYDMNTNTDYELAVDFTDDDNYWEDSLGNDASIDAHWGTEQTYLYFSTQHGRDSYDDEGSPMISYVSYDSNYFNAFWNGNWSTFGDGNGDPLTSIDVVSHEFAHGVTGNSARLIYADESGALNESFSDIFGNAAEYFADSSAFDWKIGEDFGAFRNMADPLEFGDPDTYLGSDWFTGTFDNGGVHINSGVQNYWFYLLVEGGNGINALGNSYQVDAIGWEDAAAISYRNLNYYLTESSGYPDARKGALQAAEDLFGVCSPQYIQTAAAWHAVGVGIPITSEDFGIIDISPLSDCGLTDQEQITIKIRYLGCDTISVPFIQVAYFIQDPAAAVVEVISLSDPIVGGQIIDYTFNTPADLSAFGTYEIVARTLTPTDPYQLNDSSEFIIGRNPQKMGNDTITFESYATNQEVILDSLFYESGDRAEIQILSIVGQDSSYAVRFQGTNIFAAAPPDSGQDFFDANPAYSGYINFCVDASEFNELYLDFDLRQTFTPFYEEFLGASTPGASSFRVLADGQEMARYIPTTNNDDPYQTQSINLNDFVGTNFQLVMEAKTFFARLEDPDSIGDQVFVDNIRFRGVTWPTNLEEVSQAKGLEIYPNPSKGNIVVEFEARQGIDYRLEVLDLAGRPILVRTVEASSDLQRIDMDLSKQAIGVYTIRLMGPEGIRTRRLVRD